MVKSIIETSSVTRVGLDLAKRVFRIHAVDATGSVVIARSVNRRTLLTFFDALPRCVVAMEACSSALSLAKFLNPRGRLGEAYDSLTPALEGFSPTPQLPAIAEAQALLARLAETVRDQR